MRYYSIGAFLMVRLLFFLYELPARLVKWSQKQNNQATMPKLRYWLQLFLFAEALQCMLDPERHQRTVLCHRHPLPCSSFTGGNWGLWLVSAHEIFNTKSNTAFDSQFYVSRGTLQCSLHIRLKDSYFSAEMTESQLIKFMGKKKHILDMMEGEKNISVKNSSFSLWRNRAGTSDKSTKSDTSFTIIYFQSNISSDWKK